MPARYQCFTHGQGWSWRLLGANNRVLALSADPFADAATASLDAAAVAGLAGHAEIAVVHDPGKSWRWLLLDSGMVRAMSAVPYARRMECLRAISRFRESAPVAQVSADARVFRPA